MTITDIIILTCCAFLIWKGMLQGFLGSLLGPLGLILGSVISFVYYSLTKNLLISLCIGLLGPFILTWVFRMFLHSLRNPNKELSMLSQFSGALLSLTWGLTIIIITLLLLTLIPPIKNPLVQKIYKDIHASFFYSLIKPLNPLKSTDSPIVDKKTSQKNIEELSKDKRIQEIINDPTIADAIKRKDYASLISNPKIAELMKDPQLIKKMLAVNKDRADQPKNAPAETDSKTP